MLFTSARVFLAAVFLIAGIPKLIAGSELTNSLRTLGIERRDVVVALRIGVPIVETALGVWLVTSWYPAVASSAAVFVLAGFTVVVARLRERGADSCGCFIWDDASVGVGHVVRNVVLMTMAVVILTVTLGGYYVWEPLWSLPAQSALAVVASVLFVFLMHALIATSLRFARSGT